jgi:hypothetical protein
VNIEEVPGWQGSGRLQRRGGGWWSGGGGSARRAAARRKCLNRGRRRYGVGVDLSPSISDLSPLGSSPNGKAAVPTHTIRPLLGSSAIKPRPCLRRRRGGSVDGPPLQQQAVQSIATTYSIRPAIYDLWFRQYSCGCVGVDWNDASSFLVDQVDLSEERMRVMHMRRSRAGRGIRRRGRVRVDSRRPSSQSSPLFPVIPKPKTT